MFKIKTLYKIILLCIAIFILGIYIAKINIDQTFNKVECKQAVKMNTSNIFYKTKQV